MTPLFGQNGGKPFDDLLDAVEDTDLNSVLEKAFGENGLEGADKAENQVKIDLAEMMTTRSGARVIEWLLDITVRNPPRLAGHSIEQTAMMGVAYEARHVIGEVILKNLAEGQALLDNK